MILADRRFTFYICKAEKNAKADGFAGAFYKYNARQRQSFFGSGDCAGQSEMRTSIRRALDSLVGKVAV